MNERAVVAACRMTRARAHASVQRRAERWERRIGVAGTQGKGSV